MNTTIILPAEMSYLRLVTITAWTAAEIFTDSLNVKEGVHDFCHAFELSVCEAFSNSVRYAEPSNEEQNVTICFSSCNDKLTVSVSDTNPPFDPLKSMPDINSYPEKGFGLFMIHQLMDAVSYKREDETNLITLTKQLVVTNNRTH
jgi:serine/threonine-protein kinase RsbW